ncbi:MAG TPA: hypothetical protein VLA19_28610 [Herpetosiphonaceae bacterium]|nr:hypothetical protein [Herpetosiphonaceae bacterium]
MTTPRKQPTKRQNPQEPKPAIRIPALFDTAELDGYPGLELRVRLNPSENTWTDFREGGYSASPQEAILRAALVELSEQPKVDAGENIHDPEPYKVRLAEFDQAIAERRTRMGRALVALFGTTPPQTVEVEQTDGSFVEVTLDFTTPEAALATAEDTRLPADIATWLTALPFAAREYRHEIIRSTSRSSFDKQTA